MIIFLILTGLMLIIINILAIRKDEKTFKKSLDNAGKDLTEFDVKIGELRREFSETILELQKEIRDLKLENKRFTENIRNEYEGDISEENHKDYIYSNFENNKNNKKVKEKDKENTTVVRKDNYEDYHMELEENSFVDKVIDTEVIEDEKLENEKDNFNDFLNEDDIENNDYNKDIVNNENLNDKDTHYSSMKIGEVEKLLKENLTVDEIAEKLNMGKGEVLLIKQLYSK